MTRSKYLVVTHIPFARNSEGAPLLDGLWALDLRHLADEVGPIRVAAPEFKSDRLKSWGPDAVSLPPSSGVSFRALPSVCSERSLVQKQQVRRILREEVEQATLVHTSNYFPPYLCLSAAHDMAVAMGKKTLFVVAEDFYDMLAWEWVRPTSGYTRWRRDRELAKIDRRTRKSAGTASLTLLHTPAALERYRLSAQRAMMIRHPVHEAQQVISSERLEKRLASLTNQRPLELVTACRHAGLKGLDLLIRAVALLKERGIVVHATLYGGGPETAELQKLRDQLEMQSEVKLPGSVASGNEMTQVLAEADLFVMAHRTTDFGRAFWDAMTAALPVLAFRTIASEGTVYDGLDGFLSPLDDVQGLAEKIAYLHAHRDKLAATARGARNRALENTATEWFRMRGSWIRQILGEDLRAAA